MWNMELNREQILSQAKNNMAPDLDEELIATRSMMFCLVILHFILSWTIFSVISQLPLLWGAVIGIVVSIVTRGVGIYVLLLTMFLHAILSWLLIMNEILCEENPIQMDDMIPSLVQIMVIAALQAVITTVCHFNATSRVRYIVLTVSVVGTTICELIFLTLYYLMAQGEDITPYLHIPIYCFIAMVLFHSCSMATF